MKKKILAVSDSKSLRESLRMILQDRYLFSGASFSNDLKQIVQEEGADLIILEIGDYQDEKIKLLHELMFLFKNMPFILLVDNYDDEKCFKFFKDKNISIVKMPEEFLALADRAKEVFIGRDLEKIGKDKTEGPEKDNKYLLSKNNWKFSSEVVQLLEKAVSCDAPLLVFGEKGTGRELIAKIVHNNGPRKGGNFIRLDCSDLTYDEFIELFTDRDELFPKWKFNYGTIYFNEIGALDRKLQAYLVELIEERRITTERGEFVAPNFRMIASTSKDLFFKIKRNEFSQRLFYKLSLFPINLLPLRERKDEIPLLIDMILNEGIENFNLGKKIFSPDTTTILKEYYWPFNLIELENVVLRSAMIARGEIISSGDISFYFREYSKDIMENTEPEGEELRQSRSDEKTAKVEERDGNKGKFMVELAHEIKNPLVAIKTFAHLLPENYNDPDFRENFFEVVSQDIERIDSLVEKIMEYQRVLEQPVNFKLLPEILDNVILYFNDEVLSKKIAIERNFDAKVAQYYIEGNKLTYALKNIISKLIKDAGENGKIILSIKANIFKSGSSNNDSSGDGIKLLISVKDTEHGGEEELFFRNEKHLGNKGIEIFLA